MAFPTFWEWLLIPAGFVAGVINVLAGGGSFLILPLLMATGLPLGLANGTNRIAVVLQALVATTSYLRRAPLDRRLFGAMFPPLAIGALLGAYLATQLDPKSLERVFGLLFLVMGAVLLRGVGEKAPKRLSPRLLRIFKLPALLLVGTYGGFLQAGVGLWIVVVAVSFFETDPVKANGVKLPLVLAFTIPSLFVFAQSGQLDVRRGLMLAIGTVLGALVGVRLALRGGRRLIMRATIALMWITGLVLLFRSSFSEERALPAKPAASGSIALALPNSQSVHRPPRPARSPAGSR